VNDASEIARQRVRRGSSERRTMAQSTRFLTPEGVGEVHDFTPIAGTRATGRHRLVRQN
jgi:hypothetical protein